MKFIVLTIALLIIGFAYSEPDAPVDPDTDIVIYLDGVIPGKAGGKGQGGKGPKGKSGSAAGSLGTILKGEFSEITQFL